jgi:hypothetical protein
MSSNFKQEYSSIYLFNVSYLSSLSNGFISYKLSRAPISNNFGLTWLKCLDNATIFSLLSSTHYWTIDENFSDFIISIIFCGASLLITGQIE